MAHVADDAARDRVAAPSTSTSTRRCSSCATSWPTSTRRTAQPEPGICGTPDGRGGYRLGIRMQTTVATTADEVHRVRPGGPERGSRPRRTRSRIGWATPTGTRYAKALRDGPDQPHRLARADRGAGRRADGARLRDRAAATSAGCRSPTARSRRWRSTASARRRRRSTCSPRSTARGRASTTSTPTSRRSGSSTRSPRSPSTRRRRATTSRSPSRWS